MPKPYNDKRKSFVLLFEWGDSFRLLSEQDAGRLILAIFDAREHGVMPNFDDDKDLPLKIIFNTINKAQNYWLENYIATCEQNAKNGKKGGDATANKNQKDEITDSDKSTPVELKQTETTTVNGTNVKEQDSKPTIDEYKAFCNDNGIRYDKGRYDLATESSLGWKEFTLRFYKDKDS